MRPTQSIRERTVGSPLGGGQRRGSRVSPTSDPKILDGAQLEPQCLHLALGRKPAPQQRDSLDQRTPPVYTPHSGYRESARSVPIEHLQLWYAVTRNRACRTGGAVIKREVGAGIAGSWIRRGGNDKPPLTRADSESRSAVASVPTKAHQGWDPREVWLRRIAQPRRSRVEDKS